MIEKLLAGTAIAVCAILLLGLCLGERRRERLDAGLGRAARACARAARACRRALLRAWHWPAARRNAARIAAEAIRRAQGGVTREGNVYKPKSFRRPRKPQ